MTIVIAWIFGAIFLIGGIYLGYRFVAALPDTIERYILLREKIKRERLETEKLRLEVLNEQLKDPNRD